MPNKYFGMTSGFFPEDYLEEARQIIHEANKACYQNDSDAIRGFWQALSECRDRFNALVRESNIADMTVKDHEYRNVLETELRRYEGRLMRKLRTVSQMDLF
jgi:hypothetical protein